MSFKSFLKDRITYIILILFASITSQILLLPSEIAIFVRIYVGLAPIILFLIYFFIEYYKKKNYYNNLKESMMELSEKYLIAEITGNPGFEEGKILKEIVQETGKSMLENVDKYKYLQEDYKEYIELWIHEIKLPITSAKLLCENNKSEITNKIDEEIEEINNYVEQALFYARLDQVSNDFMIRKIKLADVIKNVLSRNKKIMIQNNMKVELKNTDVSAYSDEKWLEFILNQIIINSIKYKKEQNATIIIETTENKENVKLKIKDNGIGIKKSEIDRIFDKGFTGTNGRNQKKSTGIGLYLCKRLCEEIGMNLKAESIENEYTEMIITIPRNKKINE